MELKHDIKYLYIQCSTYNIQYTFNEGFKFYGKILLFLINHFALRSYARVSSLFSFTVILFI